MTEELSKQPLITTVGTYHLKRLLGKGGGGEVWEAIEEGGDQSRLAVKILRDDRLGKMELDCLRHEFEFLTRFRHPHVARVDHFGYSPPLRRHLIVSEYCEGKPFLDACFGKPVAYVEEAAVQIFKSLDPLHGMGIVHYDIKSQNILVEELRCAPFCRLVDFGLALEGGERETGIRGTFSTMAPELQTESKEIDRRTDIYSFGMILLRHFLGEWPFDLKNWPGILAWHRQGTLPSAFLKDEKIPLYLRELVAKCLEKNPSDRWSSARAALNFLGVASGRRWDSAPFKEEKREGTQFPFPELGPFVGRKHLLESLKQKAGEFFYEKKGGFCVICGEMGLGKTRLLREFRFHLELAEIPLVEISGDRRQNSLSLLFEEEFLSGSSFDPDSPLRSTPSLLLSLIKRGEKKPFVLLIDDFDKTDPEIKKIVGEMALLVEQKKNIPFFVVITQEKMEATSPETNHVINLEPLKKEDLAHYLKGILGEDDSLSKILDPLYFATGGIPLLVMESLRSPSLLGGATLTNIYDKRLSLLKSNEMDLLIKLAVFLKPLLLEEIKAVFSQTTDMMLAILDSLKNQGLVIREGKKIRLSSQKLAFDVLGRIDSDKLKKIHEAAALSLEKTDSPPEEIADHWEKAGNREKAGAFYLEANTFYLKKGFLLLSAQCGEKALASNGLDPLSTKKLLLTLSRLMIATSSFDKAEFFLDQINDSTKKWELKGWLSLKKRNLMEARDFFQKALSSLESSDQAEIPFYRKLIIRNALADIALQEGKIGEASDDFYKNFEEEKKLPPEIQRKITNNNWGLALCLQGKIDEALDDYKKRLSLLLPSQIHEKIGVLGNLGFIALRANRIDEAVRFLEEALTLSETVGGTPQLFSILGNLFSTLSRSGRYGDALRLFEKMDHFLGSTTSGRDKAFNNLRKASLLLTLGEREACRLILEEGEEIAQKFSYADLKSWFLLLKGYFEKDFGNRDSAVIFFRQIYDRDSPENPVWKWAVLGLAEVEECGAWLKLLPSEETDDELRFKKELLKARWDGAPPETFAPFVNDCRKKGYREILREFLEAQGESLVRSDREEEGEASFESARLLVEKMALDLPEEYRLHYLNHPSRKRISEHKTKIFKKEELTMDPLMAQAKILLEKTKTLMNEHDPERVLQKILDDALSLSGAEEGMILIVDDQGEIVPRMARNLNKEDVNLIHFSRSIARNVIEGGRPLFSPQARNDENLQFESVLRFNLNSVACVPLKIHNKVTGVIYIASQQKKEGIPREIIASLELFAEYASVAYINARLFSEKEEEEKKLVVSLAETRNVLETKSAELEKLESLYLHNRRQRPYPALVGQSKKMEEIFSLMSKIAKGKVPVYLLGETGTGKELIARAIHNEGERKNFPFVAINCSAFTDTLLESELFGHQKGAFTGADRDRKGLLETAHQGTLFLDEVADMSPLMQAKLLRVLQEQEVMRVGGRSAVKIDVRIISASNKDLRKEVKEGKFREDLYYRVSGITLKIPPLRERKEDIPLLSYHLVEKIREENHFSKKVKLTPPAMERLRTHDWPGNVRELEQCLTTACLMSGEGPIEEKHLLIEGALHSSASSGEVFHFLPQKKLADYEREIILKNLDHCKGNKSESARLLGISRLTLHKKLALYERR